jgi:hypothetical protein
VQDNCGDAQVHFRNVELLLFQILILTDGSFREGDNLKLGKRFNAVGEVLVKARRNWVYQPESCSSTLIIVTASARSGCA